MARKTRVREVATDKPRIVGEVVVRRPLKPLSPNGWNPNELSAFERESLKHGLKTDGWLKSQSMLVWGKDEKGKLQNVIIDGEHRWLVATELGFDVGPMVILDGLAEKQARELTIKLDAKRGRFNKTKLSAAVRELVDETTDFDLLGTDLGIEPDTLQDLLVDEAPDLGERETGDDPEIPDAPAVAVTKFGDLIFLGKHRLLCGDSLKDLPKLIGGAQIDCVVTDPPFAIYGSSNGIGADIADDAMVRPFFESMFQAMMQHVREMAHVYVCCDWRSWSCIWESAKLVKLAPKNCLVWDKLTPGLGSSYSNGHEFVGFFSRVPPPKAMKTSTAGGQRTVLRPNMLRHARPQGEERRHNAAKPVDMFVELISNSTDEGENVLDMFGGSGTTLIACEKTKRVSFTCEKSPNECDAIIERWEKFTGQKAQRTRAAA